MPENISRLADRVLVPVIPSTLSERTFEQLLAFFAEHELEKSKVVPFFSMVQQAKNMHKETMTRMREQHAGFLGAVVPFTTDVEKMGIQCAPVLTYAKSSVAADLYQELWRELDKSL